MNVHATTPGAPAEIPAVIAPRVPGLFTGQEPDAVQLPPAAFQQSPLERVIRTLIDATPVPS